MENFERLGTFYLGKAFDLGSDEQSDELILYDSNDLTTHAVIIGMTGSGKTGLGIGLLEEAAMDKVPIIAIDPKGDLGNILLTFPKLSAKDFQPWVDPKTAKSKGQSVEEFAADQAKLWKNGLKEWGQGSERINTLRESVDMAIYTPGSSAGIPISVLQSFHHPPKEIRDDVDVYRERISATATSVLALLNIDADPLTSREHILVSTILEATWNLEQDIDVTQLIHAIQKPPVEKIGVMTVDQFFPSKDRFELSMQLNNLLAAPGFEVWMQGEALDAAQLFYSENGKPRISVVSIAHLNDSERMFFVTMLLNEIIGWMRRQSGTGSLRAILYMDEIFGYLPPSANPPSKALFLTMLKQARAYGLGLVLATQNPVDLDYKALSNAGTWFIGRLQTERDKARVMEGLEGASGGNEFDKPAMERTLAGLGKRKFLLHNVHENEPVVFSTRWVMSYLSGPFTRNQIKTLMAEYKTLAKTQAGDAPTKHPIDNPVAPSKPSLPPAVKQVYLPLNQEADEDQSIRYYPYLLGAVNLRYSNARYKINSQRSVLAYLEIQDGPIPVDWNQAEIVDFELADLSDSSIDDAQFSEIASAASNVKSFTKWERAFKTWVKNDQALNLFRSPTFKAVSKPGESEGEFRARLQVLARERRDEQVKKLREKYDRKIQRVEKRLLKAQQKLDKEKTESQSSKIDTAISVGSAILGAFTGRKRISSTSIGRIGSAVRKAGRIRKESNDVEIAEEALLEVKDELIELNQDFENEVADLDENLDMQQQALESISIAPKSADIQINYFGIAWEPHLR